MFIATNKRIANVSMWRRFIRVDRRGENNDSIVRVAFPEFVPQALREFSHALFKEFGIRAFFFVPELEYLLYRFCLFAVVEFFDRLKPFWMSFFFVDLIDRLDVLSEETVICCEFCFVKSVVV